MTKYEIEQEAEKLRLKYVPETQTKLDLIPVLKDLGGNWKMVDGEYKDGYSLFISSFGAFQSLVLSETVPYGLVQVAPTPRQRFCIAQDIGHVLLHRKQGKVQEFLRGDGSPEGIQAIWFASALLMPEKLFLDRIGVVGFRASTEKFGVTEAAGLARWDVLQLREEERRACQTR